MENSAVAERKPRGGKKPVGSRQVAFRVPDALWTRLEGVADRLGLDVSNFLRMMLIEQIGVYERRAERVERGEDVNDGS